MTLSKAMIEDEDSFPYDYTRNISYVDLENSFDVNTDDQGYFYFNLNSTINIDSDDEFSTYKLMQDMAWPLISYKIYGDTKETWTLLKLNNVAFKDVFRPVKAGTTVKYLDTTLLQQIANIMSNM